MEKFNILVCDDEKAIVDAIEIYLKQEGYNVIKAYNGLEALKALEENEIQNSSNRFGSRMLFCLAVPCNRCGSPHRNGLAHGSGFDLYLLDHR